MRLLTALFLVAFSSLLLLSSGCPECKGIMCGPCGPAVTLTVTDDVTGLAVPDLMMGALPCHERADGSVTECSTGIAAGTYSFDLTAPGYESRTVEVVVSEGSRAGCCSCGFQATSVQTTLVPL